MNIKKNVFWISTSIIIVVLAGFFLNGGSTGNTVSGSVVNSVTGAASGEIQIVKMHVEVLNIF